MTGVFTANLKGNVPSNRQPKACSLIKLESIMQISFIKMAGAGNDFIVIDNREGILAEAGRRELYARWCARRVGVGADGVLLVEPPENNAHFRMRYYNADGGEAESCGNGARCIARFA
jgi:diaminopimelate epimerase